MGGIGELAILILSFWHVIVVNCADDILVGCGGFVKSDVEINYSLIEIKLYTKQGSLKYQTDCAPFNGYFMIPLYDKGDFVLKIEPPSGWSFEPTTVDLHVDGINDICTKEQDINFLFTGFSVLGTVLSKGHLSGPAGVEVSLRKAGENDVLHTVLTQASGQYTFLKVLPGSYDITASHATWTLEQSSTTVVLLNENAPASAPLIVKGYDVSGEVQSDGEPMRGVNFLLYSPGVTQEVPYYRGERITFDVAPSRMNFKVQHDSLILEPVFRVMGFSVMGRVLNSLNGEGVADAVVMLNNQIKAETKEDGSFRLENMTTGTYTITSQKELMFFEPITVKIAPSTPQLPDIITAGFSVCGQILVSSLPEGVKQLGRYKVTLSAQSQDQVLRTIESDSQGAFCFQVKPDDYSVQVSLPEAEVKAGLALQPYSLHVSLVDHPITDLLFTQFIASVSGSVSCLVACADLTVTLQPLSRQGERQNLQLSGSSETLSFTFNNVLPGKYKVAITQEEWCWKHKSVEIDVLDSDVQEVEFRQIGYLLRCTLSHAITLEFFQDGSTPENVGIYNLSKGVNRFCLSKPGVYKVTPRSCHQFEQDYYTYNTSAPSILTLTAVRHHMTGVIITDKMLDVTVTIKSSIESEPALVLGPLLSVEEQRREQQLLEIAARMKEKQERGEEQNPPVQEKPEELQKPFHYEFSYWARAGEKITVTPSSKEFLFYPPEVEATITGENCPGQMVEIAGRAGLFLMGQVSPSLEGVEISIKESGSTTTLITVLTDETGSYSVGPLHSDSQYDIIASKEGFVLTPVEGKTGDFKAFALAGVTFEIKAEDSVPLSGVLLSLSGANFRSNLLTQDTGLLAFNNLSPGQYYFKPMMKEFRFEPSAQMITVEEGQVLHIPITGFKTAYSCYGTVQSLGGDAEQSVAVEAMGQEECSMYSEDTITDEEGRFRLRGLLPGCNYNIQLRGEGNEHIERALPPHKTIERKIPDQDVAQGSYIALPLTLLLLLAVYNHERVIPILLQLVNQIQGVRGLSQTSGDGIAVDEAKRQSKKPKMRRT
ncbi:Nodal modulator 1 pM5 protein [Triplophysa tibetana]|uniref:Nodal modulator 1 pM5 protein n=1 Tax=Triplophysa tibetana TaxID=1572043 RepID=A0A5A9NWK3_9TELE|nr:Nodal modulator 1 pM5 protein [Triplophysa tibetana]